MAEEIGGIDSVSLGYLTEEWESEKFQGRFGTHGPRQAVGVRVADDVSLGSLHRESYTEGWKKGSV